MAVITLGLAPWFSQPSTEAPGECYGIISRRCGLVGELVHDLHQPLNSHHHQLPALFRRRLAWVRPHSPVRVARAKIQRFADGAPVGDLRRIVGCLDTRWVCPLGHGNFRRRGMDAMPGRDKTDPYAVFEKMLGRGNPPDDWDALTAATRSDWDKPKA